MTVTACDVPSRPRRVGAHGLLMAETDRERRVGASAWVDHQLAGGAKVYYKGWFPEGLDPREHWLSDALGASRVPAAVASGQLEFLDFPTVVARCGGTTDGLHELQTAEVTRALEQGWPRVAMSQESPRRPMADEDEAAELAAQEAGYDALALRWPLTTLCQLTLDEENAAAAWESTAVHHSRILEAQWACSRSAGRWHLQGTLDAHVAPRVGAALHGALRAARDAEDGPDLHVDLSEVEFADLAFVQTLFLAARSVAHRQRVVLHGSPRPVHRLVEAVGRPGSVLVDGRAAR